MRKKLFLKLQFCLTSKVIKLVKKIKTVYVNFCQMDFIKMYLHNSKSRFSVLFVKKILQAMVIDQQIKKGRHDQMYCMLLSFNFLFFLLKIQIIYVVGPMSDVILISSIKSISKFQGKLFINYTVMWWLSLLYKFIQQNLDLVLCIIIGTIS